ncbi:hypothetical protein Phum_PHUM396490 [Pediculus humanus corporis]|uniref:Uncharacterized protein n=1 Tax=Pediculus humanus subsp. corporis TaxID=121224 RepID=E0VRB7_PEDHC|nr:uncharacterized protein Phum_PHUM396490 [Pediculus humanus corporis]EEB15923.1 hypothetical protein Phum_PHUM396490 [Pediculus humanus corporis]
MNVRTRVRATTQFYASRYLKLILYSKINQVSEKKKKTQADAIDTHKRSFTSGCEGITTLNKINKGLPSLTVSDKSPWRVSTLGFINAFSVPFTSAPG